MSKAIYFSDSSIIEIQKQHIDELRIYAEKEPLRRARYCMHKNPEATVQEMLIGLMQDTYARPHRHKNKEESFHLVLGSLSVFIFNDIGDVVTRIRMSEFGTGSTFYYRLPENIWHSVVIESEFAVIHETTKGPFVKTETEMATWAPEEGDVKGIGSFRKKLVG